MSPRSLPGKFRQVSHTADVGIEVQAGSAEDLYLTAGMALFRIMVAGKSPAQHVRVPLEISGLDREDLLVRFLNELLYVFQEEQRIVEDIRISELSETLLRADLDTVPFDPRIHQVRQDVKAATYHRVLVEAEQDRWTARAILDV